MAERAVVSSGAHDLDALFRSHRRSMVRLAYLLTGSTEVADDVVQDAFVSLDGRLADTRDPGAYLRQIVVNRARQHHRRAALERRRAPEPPGPLLPAELDETWDALWQLTERQRVALVLRFYQDLSVRQVAAAMQCPEGTVKALLHRGVEALREVLEP